MADLQKNFPAQIVPGSNEIITPNMFLKQLENLHKFDIKKIRQGDSSEIGEAASFLGLSGNRDDVEETGIFDEDEL